MPSFSDSENKIYSVSYDTLVSIFKTYFNKVVYYKNLKESLVSQCLNCNTLSDIETLNWCDTKVLVSNIQSTKIVTNVEKTSIQNCEDITVSGPLCDPPCDPDSCESCVNGECIGLCQETDECCNSICYSDSDTTTPSYVTLPVGTASCSALGGSGWTYAGMCEAAPPASGMPELECVCCCPDGYFAPDPVNCPCLCVQDT
jgi:hypothetical protein